MDFLDPQKKRAHRTRLYIGYGLTAIALAAATYILASAAYGFGIDRHTGTIIQNGLIIVDAHPESASVVINKINRGTTSTRQVLPAGEYTVSLQRAGYRTWEHQVSLEGATIEQLAYPFLFPEKLVTKPIQEYSTTPRLAIESPDRHWLVTQSDPLVTNFSVTDLINSKNPTTTISLPAETITAGDGTHAFEPVEWSNDNRHLLMKHTVNGISEFIMVDRSIPSASVNISKLFPDLQITTVSTRDKRNDQVYLFNSSTGNLLLADLSAKTATLLVSGVISYKSYQADTIAYITNPDAAKNTVEMHLRQNTDDHLMRTLPVGAAYHIDMAQFDGHFYLVCGSSADGHTYVYKDPFNDLNHHPIRTPQPFRVLIVPGTEYVSFSGIARFIVAQNGSNFAVYDSETSRQFRYDLKLPVVEHQKAVWMDGHRLSMVVQDKVLLFDFDGTNKQTLSPSLGTFPVLFDRDYTAMFTIAQVTDTPGKTTLTRTELKVLPAGGASR